MLISFFENFEICDSILQKEEMKNQIKGTSQVENKEIDFNAQVFQKSVLAAKQYRISIMNQRISSKPKERDTFHQLNVKLHHPNKEIHIKVGFPCPMKTLMQLLIQSLPASTPKVAYFETKNGDLLVDYKLQRQIGFLRNDCQLRCVIRKKNAQVEQGMESYHILKCVGMGGFSKVYMVRNKQDGNFFVAKFIEKERIKEKLELIVNERRVNQEIDFPFLVKMREFIDIPKFFVMILDYCPGGELFHLQRKVHRFDEESAKRYFIEVLLALEYLHSKKIIYRDLKPENIMLDQEGHIRIADFGLAKITKERRYSYCGSLQYMSPQMVARVGHSFEVDFYCLGALLFQMVVGCPPFYEPNSTQMTTKYRILNEEVYFPHDLPISDNVKDLIRSLLQKNPNKRLGHFGGVNEIKCHPWIGWINRSDYLLKKVEMPHRIDLDCFNFDSNDISPSANRLVITMKHFQRGRKRQAILKKSLQKNKERNLSPYKEEIKLKRFQSHGSIIRRTLSKDSKKKDDFLSKIANIRKMCLSRDSFKKDKISSIQYCYLSNSVKSVNLSKFLRYPTQNVQIKDKSRSKQRKTNRRLETQCNQNDKSRDNQGLRKKRAKQLYFFMQIKRR